jgi:hypothetical protein
MATNAQKNGLIVRKVVFDQISQKMYGNILEIAVSFFD